jgi:hypothetical protein
MTTLAAELMLKVTIAYLITALLIIRTAAFRITSSQASSVMEIFARE